MQTRVAIAGGIATISLAGRFDFSAHRIFRDTCKAVLESGEVYEVEVDLGEVDCLDSSALGMLLMLREKALAANKTVTLVGFGGAVQQVLDIANFGKLFRME